MNVLDIQSQKKPFTVVCWRHPQEFKFGYFMKLFHTGRETDSKKRVCRNHCFVQMRNVLLAISFVIA